MKPDDGRSLDPTDFVWAACLGGVALAYYVAVSAWLWPFQAAAGGDGFYVYLTARSLVFDHDLDLQNQLAAFGDPLRFGDDPARDGFVMPYRELGPALLMAVPLGLHQVFALKSDFMPWGAGLLVPLCLPALYLGLVRVLRGPTREAWVSRGYATCGALGFVPTFYAVFYTGYAHAPDAAVGAWLIAAFLRPTAAVHRGLWVALALLFRLQNALWLLLPWYAWARRPRERKTLSDAVVVTAVAALGVLPQVYLALAHPGTVRGSIYWDVGFFDLEGFFGDLVEVLVGVHGWVRVTPLVLLGALGLAWPRRPASALPSQGVWLVLVTMLVLVACTMDPDAGHAFGARRQAGTTVLFVIGLLNLDRVLTPKTHRRVAYRVLVGLLVFANLLAVDGAVRGIVSLDP